MHFIICTQVVFNMFKGKMTALDIHDREFVILEESDDSDTKI